MRSFNWLPIKYGFDFELDLYSVAPKEQISDLASVYKSDTTHKLLASALLVIPIIKIRMSESAFSHQIFTEAFA